ncbi:hypothetical protein ACJX0J_026924, partial [Zea mays]
MSILKKQLLKCSFLIKKDSRIQKQSLINVKRNKEKIITDKSLVNHVSLRLVLYCKEEEKKLCFCFKREPCTIFLLGGEPC